MRRRDGLASHPSRVPARRASPGHSCPSIESAAILHDGLGHRGAADAWRVVEALGLTARPREPPALCERPHHDVLLPLGPGRNDDGHRSVPICDRHRLSALDARERRTQLVLELPNADPCLRHWPLPAEVATCYPNVAICQTISCTAQARESQPRCCG